MFYSTWMYSVRLDSTDSLFDWVLMGFWIFPDMLSISLKNIGFLLPHFRF